MPTTLPIDDELVAELGRLSQASGVSVEALVNEALRRGLREMAAMTRPSEPFRTKTFDAGAPLIPNLDCIGEVLALLDAEEFMERQRRSVFE